MKTNKKRIVVCITARVSCVGLVQAALDIATRAELPLEVITVLPKVQPATERAAALIALNTISKTQGVDITIYYSDMASYIVAEHTRKNKAVRVITGLPGENSKGFAESLALFLPEIPITAYTGQIMYTLPTAMPLAALAR